MSSIEEKPRGDLPTKKSSDSVKDLAASGEKGPAEHVAVEAATTPKTDDVPTVGFTELFRYAPSSSLSSRILVIDPILPRFLTWTEIFLDIIGLVFASAAGAAQVSFAFLFPAPHSSRFPPIAVDEFGLWQANSGLHQPCNFPRSV